MKPKRQTKRPEDLNAHGTLFGGSLLRWIDDEAVVYAAIQLGNTRVVTKFISEIDFVSSARLGDNLRIALEPIKNPVTGDPEQVAVNHGTGFIFKEAECASAREGAVAIEELNFSYPDKAGYVARIHYGN